MLCAGSSVHLERGCSVLCRGHSRERSKVNIQILVTAWTEKQRAWENREEGWPGKAGSTQGKLQEVAPEVMEVLKVRKA